MLSFENTFVIPQLRASTSAWLWVIAKEQEERSLENNHGCVLSHKFARLELLNLRKKTQSWVTSWKFAEILQNSFFEQQVLLIKRI